MAEYTLLNKINSPKDIKHLSEAQLNRLATEIRRYIIETVERNGGHLASNLGTVELTLALHKVFDSPADQIVWDVGHQSYTHKLLTGRREAFATLRREGGISGFSNPAESEHDICISGHSSNSISIASGLAAAKRLKGEDSFAIAVLGDGALTGGLVYEALNNAGRTKDRLIVILNDNEMSISKNVGSVAKYLTRLRTNPEYFQLKDQVKSAVMQIPVAGQAMYDFFAKSKKALRQSLYKTTFFEDLGFRYLGPVDGHNIKNLVEVFQRAKVTQMPVLIHVQTKKGKGYRPAERFPHLYHGVSPAASRGQGKKESFSSVFGQTLAQLARQDRRICAISAAMTEATGLDAFRQDPQLRPRLFDVGMAEAHGLTFACGLAIDGFLPVFAVYSTFLQRAYDQMLHDASIVPRHVILAVDRAGIVGEDGATHQGVFDIPMISSLPGSVIYSPANYEELKIQLKQAIYEETGLAAVRYPRGGEDISVRFEHPEEPVSLREKKGAKTLLVSYGREAVLAAQAADAAHRPASVLKLNRVFPLPQQALETARHYRRIVFVEESMASGGIGEHFSLMLQQAGWHGSYRLAALGHFVEHATVPQALQREGLDAGHLAALIDEEDAR